MNPTKVCEGVQFNASSNAGTPGVDSSYSEWNGLGGKRFEPQSILSCEHMFLHPEWYNAEDWRNYFITGKKRRQNQRKNRDEDDEE